ncbi:ABC-three component system middle component 1 [Aeromonas sp. 61P]|uniref:ABC-three component system middle component 1 n=1 Tax=Aeromonas sp. 61P TaxID=3452721 RepID=UPI003F7AF5D8
MLSDFINDAILEHSFVLVEQQYEDYNNLLFYKKELGEFQRYVITISLDEMIDALDVDVIHDKVLNYTPDNLLASPAFSKNTDLIVLLKLDNLANYKKLEEIIFSIEENPYHFKKYVLYYTEDELSFIAGKKFIDIKEILNDHAEFINYKSYPLKPCIYNMVARIFIKIPFLIMPALKKDLIPVNLQISSLVNELQMTTLYEKIAAKAVSKDNDIDLLLQELINEELEAIQATSK